jgi:hypothetical protein
MTCQWGITKIVTSTLAASMRTVPATDSKTRHPSAEHSSRLHSSSGPTCPAGNGDRDALRGLELTKIRFVRYRLRSPDRRSLRSVRTHSFNGTDAWQAGSDLRFRVEAKGLEPSNLLTASQALYQLSYAPED